MTFRQQATKPNLWVIQQAISQYWSDNHIFEKSIREKSADNPYRFYDGPPFITGLPHYGHLASSVAKDVIPRFWTMKGKRVERVRGWDCHGIPIEQKVQKKLGLESNLDIENVGIETFINQCYSYTRSTSSEWKWYVDNFARWVDFDNAYKTMDNDYMESVWRVFKQVWDKGLIYKGKRVSMYSTKLETPISNFEVAMDDSYDDVNDPAITVKFPVDIDGEKVFVLAWTTTPWTIPANMALGVHKDIEYVKVEVLDSESQPRLSLSGAKLNSAGSSEGPISYIVAKKRAEDVFKGKDYEIVDEFSGEKLLGLSYRPPFDYFYQKGNDWDHQIVFADFATDESGTGIVHQAPEFGEDDFNLGKDAGLTITEAMNASGHYTEQISDMQGMFYRDANDAVMEKLAEKGLLFAKGSITHRIAHCPRSGVPLVYKAQDSWFVDIQSVKQILLEKNEEINRYPEHFKYGRFAKSIETAPDRGISRTRYRGTPMPVYAKESDVLAGRVDAQAVVVVSSRKELYELQKNGSDIMEKREVDGEIVYWHKSRDCEFDMHRPFIDEVWFEKNGEKYVRIPEVLDCWFESGSMPYGQMHYPFENKEKMEASFPADYIVEYTGQIRAWFYVMHVLGVILFDKPAFKNVICHGVVYGNDGRKMSKSLGNFPDPKPSFEKYGGDAIRMSILSSPLFHAGDTSITEEGFGEALRNSILPLWNAFSFFVTYANIDKWTPDESSQKTDLSKNILDRWIISELQELIIVVEKNLTSYDLQQSSRALGAFLDNLTNRYIRRSRRRFWKSENDGDKLDAYATLYHVLVNFCTIAAPFMPFITEYIYRELVGDASVHLQDFPKADEKLIDKHLEKDMKLAQDVIRIGLGWRSKHTIRVRQPLASVTIGVELDEYYKEIVAEELNVKEVIVDTAINNTVTKICKPNGKLIGPKYGSDVKEIMKEAKAGNFEENEDGTVSVKHFKLQADEYEISYIKKDPNKDVEVEKGIVVAVDGGITAELALEGMARDLVRYIQEARKEADYDIAERIQLSIEQSDFVAKLIQGFGDYIQQETLSTLVEKIDNPDLEKEVAIGAELVVLSLVK